MVQKYRQHFCRPHRGCCHSRYDNRFADQNPRGPITTDHLFGFVSRGIIDEHAQNAYNSIDSFQFGGR